MSMGFAPTGGRPIAGEIPNVIGVPLPVKWTNDRTLAAEYTNDTTLAAEYEPSVEE